MILMAQKRLNKKLIEVISNYVPDNNSWPC